MRARSPLVREAIVVSLAGILAGCASNPAPRGWRPPAPEAQRSPRGGFVAVERGDGSKVRGELLAVDAETLHVLTAAGVVAVPRASARRIRLVGYGTARGLGGAALLGTLSTASHGYFLVFTAPLWMISGAVAASDEAKAAFIEPEDFRAFARFPQGLPPDLEPVSLGALAEAAVTPSDDRRSAAE